MSTDINQRGFERFGKTLRKLRLAKKLSMRSLSYVSNVEYSQIGKIEKGYSDVHLSTILKLARGLEVQPHVLLQGEYELD